MTKKNSHTMEHWMPFIAYFIIMAVSFYAVYNHVPSLDNLSHDSYCQSLGFSKATDSKVIWDKINDSQNVTFYGTITSVECDNSTIIRCYKHVNVTIDKWGIKSSDFDKEVTCDRPAGQGYGFIMHDSSYDIGDNTLHYPTTKECEDFFKMFNDSSIDQINGCHRPLNLTFP